LRYTYRMDDQDAIDFEAESPEQEASSPRSLELNAEQRKLFDAHLPLVNRLAHQKKAILPANFEIDDLRQVAMIGLIKAAQRYVAQDAVATFETFATSHVKGSILDYMRSLSVASRGLVEFSNMVNAATNKFSKTHGFKPTRAHLAASLEMDLTKFEKRSLDATAALNITTAVTNLKLTNENEDMDALDGVPSEELGPAGQLEKKQRLTALSHFIDGLDDRTQSIFNMHVVDGDDLKTIAAVFGVTESRISQIYNQTLGKLDTFMEERFGENIGLSRWSAPIPAELPSIGANSSGAPGKKKKTSHYMDAIDKLHAKQLSQAQRIQTMSPSLPPALLTKADLEQFRQTGTASSGSGADPDHAPIKVDMNTRWG
jgi:RNA polymerase sigma factor for flagellar operon FliA